MKKGATVKIIMRIILEKFIDIFEKSLLKYCTGIKT